MTKKNTYSFPFSNRLSSSTNPLLRHWCIICLGVLWRNEPDIGGAAMRNGTPAMLIELLDDQHVAVRAAAAFALGE